MEYSIHMEMNLLKKSFIAIEFYPGLSISLVCSGAGVHTCLVRNAVHNDKPINSAIWHNI